MNAPSYTSLPERFWNRVEEQESGCWTWTGHTLVKGYGRITIAKRRMQTHRLAAEDFHGEIPDGMWVLHTCDNPPCVNPKHLYFGTARDNSNDMMKRGRSPKGEAHARSKFTEHDIAEMRELSTSGRATRTEIQEKFGVSEPHLRKIISGDRWGHSKDGGG